MMELSEVKKHLTSDSCFLSQEVECDYKQFGCTVVLPRKDIAEHLKTSVETHLQLTRRRLEEQEVRLQGHEVRLRQIMNEVIAHREEAVKDRVEEHEARLQEGTKRKLMEEKMHKTNTLMLWLLVYVPVLLVVVILVGYHQGLLPPILAIMLSYVLCLFSAIHYQVL